MSLPPWEPHHVASPDELKAALRNQFPGVGWEGLRHLGSGWEFDVWHTSDDWVFRFPRRDEAPAQLERERPILELVRAALEPSVAVPRPELWGKPGPHFPYPFAGHRLVEGVAADHPGVPRHAGLPSEIGGALGRLHALPTEEGRQAGLLEEREGLTGWLDEARERVRALEGMSREIDGFVGRLDGLSLPASYDGPLRVVHNDLFPEHLLVDPSTGALAGILDWTDTALGDPALDFLFLATWRGWEMVESVLEHYPLPLDPDFRVRLSRMARIRSLIWLQEAVARDGDLEKHLGWVRNAFGGP